jgi:hypothetical protein
MWLSGMLPPKQKSSRDSSYVKHDGGGRGDGGYEGRGRGRGRGRGGGRGRH